MASHIWTCQRVSNGVKCGFENPKRRMICQACGKRRAPTKKPAHMQVLEVLSYEACVQLFGEQCGICGREPPEVKLVRDHDHHQPEGVVRGLACIRCNYLLNDKIDNVEWLEKAAEYLRRSGIRSVG